MNPGRPLRVCYADPPYPGMARRFYRRPEVDHAALVADLVRFFPDGWALSTHAPALRLVLPLCPPGVRVAAWVKPWVPWKGSNPVYAWEPVLWVGGRAEPLKKLSQGGRPAVRDYLACNATSRTGLRGAKPEAFACWVFDLLGLRPGDELVDLFPGTGAVTRAWQAYTPG